MQIRKLRIARYAPLLPGVRRKRNNHTVAAGKRGVHVMASTFTWLDYSESDRQKMQDVLDQLGERTTRDELGIGGIRDAFAELLFPGTTTIQTAAKYFLFVPWMYVQLEQKYVPSKDVLAIARKFEDELSKTLSDEDVDGVIGRRAGENLKRTASSVYWQGLLKWGIRTFPGSQDSYHRSLDKLYLRRKGRVESKTEFDGEGSDGAGVHNWHPNLIDPDNSFPKTASLKLAKHEAIYLRERVLSNCDGSLLAYLLKHPGHVEGVDFAWHLEMSLNPQSLLAEQLKHGQNFSEVMHGAQLLYNLILAEQSLNADKTAEPEASVRNQRVQLIQPRIQMRTLPLIPI